MITNDQPAGIAAFFAGLRSSIAEHSLVKLVLGKYRGTEPDPRNIVIRALSIKGQECLSFVYRHRTKDITKNFPVAAGLDAVGALLGGDFKSGHLFTTTENIQIEFSKKGKCMVSRNAATAAALGGHPRSPSGGRGYSATAIAADASAKPGFCASPSDLHLMHN